MAHITPHLSRRAPKEYVGQLDSALHALELRAMDTELAKVGNARGVLMTMLQQETENGKSRA